MTVNTVSVHFLCRSVNHLVHADTARGDPRNGAVYVFCDNKQTFSLDVQHSLTAVSIGNGMCSLRGTK
jgi:hypothetical protein